MIRLTSILGAALFVVGAFPMSSPAQQPMPDSAEIVRTVQRFHDVIAAGDSLAALALLSEDALVLESGELKTKAEFRQHHLPADIAFAQSTKGERRVHSVTQRVTLRGSPRQAPRPEAFEAAPSIQPARS